MIDSKYIELINRDIDKVISPNEKKELEDYLEINPDAEELHRELLLTEELLDRLPNNDPSANLKKRILNSIDYNRYSSKNKKSSFAEYFKNIFSGSSAKLATSFALVLVIGTIIVFSFYLTSNFKNNLEDENVFGTIGVTNNQLLEIVKIDVDKISGDIQIIKEANLYKFIINVNSSEKYNLQIDFDPENVTLNNSHTENNIKISEDKSSIVFANLTNLLNEIDFKSKNISHDTFSIKLYRDDNKLFQREIILPFK